MKRSTIRGFPRAGDQVEDHLGVRGRLEDRAFADQLVAQGQEVGQVAVVGEGDAAGLEVGEHRLDVADEAAAGGGVAGVADGDVAGQALDQVGAGEGVADMAHVAFGVEALAVEGGDAAGFLAAVLQGVQAERGRRRRRRRTSKTPNTPHSRRRRVVVGVARRSADRSVAVDGSSGLLHQVVEVVRSRRVVARSVAVVGRSAPSLTAFSKAGRELAGRRPSPWAQAPSAGSAACRRSADRARRRVIQLRHALGRGGDVEHQVEARPAPPGRGPGRSRGRRRGRGCPARRSAARAAVSSAPISRSSDVGDDEDRPATAAPCASQSGSISLRNSGPVTAQAEDRRPAAARTKAQHGHHLARRAAHEADRRPRPAGSGRR